MACGYSQEKAGFQCLSSMQASEWEAHMAETLNLSTQQPTTKQP
jgi:hypothetical protein